MTHLEGPIVDSVYDMALLTWHDEMKPPLPLIGQNRRKDSKLFETQSFLDLCKNFPEVLCQNAVNLNDKSGRLPEHRAGEPHYDPDLSGEMIRMQSRLTPIGGERLMDLVTDHLSMCTVLNSYSVRSR